MSSGRRLYIGRLAQDATRRDIEKFFDKYGSLVDVRVMNGFGFVEFETSKDAEDAVADKNGEKFLGESIILEVAKDARRRDMYDGGRGGDSYGDRRGPPPSRIPPRAGRGRIIVKGISSGMSWQDLKDFGRESGANVSFADVDRENPGQGIIEFATTMDAEDAVKKLDGMEIRGVRVEVVLDNGTPSTDWRRDDGPPRRDDRRDDRGYASRRDDRGYDRRDDRGYDRRDDRDRRDDSDYYRRGDDRDYRRDDRRDDYRRSDRDDRDSRRRDSPPRRERSRSPVRRRDDDRDDRRRSRSPVRDGGRSRSPVATGGDEPAKDDGENGGW